MRFDLSNCQFAFLDLETTGLSPWFGDRICEVGIVLTEGKRIRQTYQQLVNPERPLSPAAASTNGLSDAELRLAPRFDEVAAEVEALLTDAVIVCHNAQFDLQFLDSEFRRVGREIQIPNLIDTLSIARAHFELPSYTLASLAEAFHIQNPQAHRALADALTDKNVFFAMMEGLRLLKRPFDDFIGIYNSPAAPPQAVELPVALREAIAQKRPLHITYIDPKGKRTERLISEVAVTQLADYIYLHGYCHLRQENRSFRLDRILEIRI